MEREDVRFEDYDYLFIRNYKDLVHGINYVLSEFEFDEGFDRDIQDWYDPNIELEVDALIDAGNFFFDFKENRWVKKPSDIERVIVAQNIEM